MVSTGKFLLQLLQTKFACIHKFPMQLLWIPSVFDVCSGGLVDFKFGIDCQKMSKYTESTEMNVKLCKYPMI